MLLGNIMMFDHRCKYEEPLRYVAMDFDWPKVSLFSFDQDWYSFSPPSLSEGKGPKFLVTLCDLICHLRT